MVSMTLHLTYFLGVFIMMTTFVEYLNAFPFAALENVSSEEEWKEVNAGIRKEMLEQCGGYIRDILVEEMKSEDTKVLDAFPKIKEAVIEFVKENVDVIPQDGDSPDSFPSKARVIVDYVRKLKDLGLAERLDAAMAA